MDQPNGDDSKSRPDEDFYDFLIRIFFLRCIFYALIIWVSLPAYTVPLILWGIGVPLAINIFWTLISLAITYLLLILIGYPFILLYYKKYVKNHWWRVEEQALVVQHGVFTRVKARIPYSRIQNVNVKQTWFERIGGFYTIEVETAGATINTNKLRPKPEGYMTGVLDPEPIVEAISQKMLQSKQPAAQPPDASPGDKNNGTDPQEDILTYLRSIDKNLRKIAKQGTK